MERYNLEGIFRKKLMLIFPDLSIISVSYPMKVKENHKNKIKKLIIYKEKHSLEKNFKLRSLKINSLMIGKLLRETQWQKIQTIRMKNVKDAKRQEQLYIHLDKMNRLLMKYNLVKLTQSEIDNLNIPIPRIKNCNSNENTSDKKTSDDCIIELSQIFKKELIPIL